MTIRRARAPAESGVSLRDTLTKAGLDAKYVELFESLPHKVLHVDPRRPFREPGAPRDEVMLVRSGILAKFKTIGELAPEAFKAFVAFDEAVVRGGVVPLKYKELIAVARANPMTVAGSYTVSVAWAR